MGKAIWKRSENPHAKEILERIYRFSTPRWKGKERGIVELKRRKNSMFVKITHKLMKTTKNIVHRVFFFVVEHFNE
jgi:hypothetical protein